MWHFVANKGRGGAACIMAGTLCVRRPMFAWFAAVVVATVASNVTIHVDNFFIHIPKTGGESFERYLKAGQLGPLVPCFDYADAINASLRDQGKICATNRCFVQPPARKKNCNTAVSEVRRFTNLDVHPSVRLLTFVRNPMLHELSMYAHCQSPGSPGQARHGYPPISFSDYIAFRVANPRNTTFCGYSPFNKQVSVLGGGADKLAAALDLVDSSFFVGVTEEYDASLCLLRSLIAGRAACFCGARQPPPEKTFHRTHGTTPGDIALSGNDRRQIGKLTKLDAVLHARALSKLHQGLARFNLSCLL